MKQQALIFLKPFSIKNPTLDEQNDFMMTEVVTEVECDNLGKIYDNDVLHGKDLAVFIPEEVKAHTPPMDCRGRSMRYCRTEHTQSEESASESKSQLRPPQ